MWQYADIRKKAWDALTQGSAINAIAATLLYTLIVGVPITLASTIFFIFSFTGMLSGIYLDTLTAKNALIFATIFLFFILILFVVSIFVITPLAIGYNRYLMNIVQKKPDNRFSNLFWSFRKERYLSHVSCMFMKSLRLCVPFVAVGVLSSLVFVSFFYLTRFSAAESTQSGEYFLAILYLFLLIIAVVSPITAYIWFFRNVYAYRFTEFILAEYEGLHMNQAVNISVDLTKGIKFRLFILGITFMGWQFLNYIASGLLSYWIIPYMTTAYYKVYCIQKAEHADLFYGLTSSGDEMQINTIESAVESVNI